MPNLKPQTNDLQASDNLKRINDLEDFKKNYEGQAFDDKVLASLIKDRNIEKEIKKIAWQTIREKIVWIIIGGVGIIFTDLILRAIPHIIKSI